MQRFELWLVNEHPSNVQLVGKTRPVVIIQTDLLNSVHPTSVVCPLTPNFKENFEILRVRVESVHISLKTDILVDQIFTLDNRRFIKKLGKLTAKQIERLTYSLKVVLDL